MQAASHFKSKEFQSAGLSESAPANACRRGEMGFYFVLLCDSVLALLCNSFDSTNYKL